MKRALRIKILLTILALTSLGVGATLHLNSSDGEVQKSASANVLTGTDSVVASMEIASNGDVGSLSATGISWAGEVISYGDAQITPSRDGQIADLYIKIGDTVSAGQSIGRLAPPPSSLELTALLAEKKQALISAEAQAAATKKLVSESKKRLKKIETAIYRSRDTALAVAEKEAIQNSNTTTGAGKELESLQKTRAASITSAQAELTQAEQVLPVKFNLVRAAVRAIVQRFAGAISTHGVVFDSLGKISPGFQFDSAYGAQQPISRNEYIKALQNLVAALNTPTTIPEDEVNAYIKASIDLMSSSVASYNVTVDDLDDLRDIIFEDEQIYNEALSDYRDAKNNVDVKRALLEKMTVGSDRDIINAEATVRVNEAYLDTNESMKQNQIAQADEEYTKEKAALDAKISELNRQLAITNAEVQAAGAAYNLVETGIGEDIRAPRSGVISAIYVNVGRYVSIDTPIAASSSMDEKQKFVRFRIPLDMKLPEMNDTVLVERPGYPLAPKKATITGIGISLDENGSYQADAEFSEPVDWPANLSVRILYSTVNNSILIPFTSIWWDDEEIAHVWLVDSEGSVKSRKVTLGKAYGDRIGIDEGLAVGDRFISVVIPNLRDGMIVAEAGSATESGGPPTPAKSMEGHGHGDL